MTGKIPANETVRMNENLNRKEPKEVLLYTFVKSMHGESLKTTFKHL